MGMITLEDTDGSEFELNIQSRSTAKSPTSTFSAFLFGSKSEIGSFPDFAEFIFLALSYFCVSSLHFLKKNSKSWSSHFDEIGMMRFKISEAAPRFQE